MTPIIDGREQEPELVLIGDLPVMLKSKLCVLSQLTPEDEQAQMISEHRERLRASINERAEAYRNRLIEEAKAKGQL